MKAARCEMRHVMLAAERLPDKSRRSRCKLVWLSPRLTDVLLESLSPCATPSVLLFWLVEPRFFGAAVRPRSCEGRFEEPPDPARWSPFSVVAFSFIDLVDFGSENVHKPLVCVGLVGGELTVGTLMDTSD